MTINPDIRAFALGYEGATYAAERAAAHNETVLVSDDDLVALVASLDSPMLPQIAAALNTMDSVGLLRQLCRLAKGTKRRPARLWRRRDRWYVEGR
jgi:hypothetical protein